MAGAIERCDFASSEGTAAGGSQQDTGATSNKNKLLTVRTMLSPADHAPLCLRALMNARPLQPANHSKKKKKDPGKARTKMTTYE